MLPAETAESTDMPSAWSVDSHGGPSQRLTYGTKCGYTWTCRVFMRRIPYDHVALHERASFSLSLSQRWMMEKQTTTTTRLRNGSQCVGRRYWWRLIWTWWGRRTTTDGTTNELKYTAEHQLHSRYPAEHVGNLSHSRWWKTSPWTWCSLYSHLLYETRMAVVKVSGPPLPPCGKGHCWEW